MIPGLFLKRLIAMGLIFLLYIKSYILEMRNQYFRKADLKIFEILIPEIPDPPVPM